MRRSVEWATTRLTTPPRAASTHASQSGCAINCQRLAPSDRRTAISAARLAARARSRLAMLAHAINNTTIVVENSRISGRADLAKQPALSSPALLDDDLLRLELRQRPVAQASLERRFHVVEDGAIGCVDGRAGLLDRNAGPEPREEVHPVAAPVVEGVVAVRHQAAHGDRTNTCGRDPRVVPRKPRGATPTIVIGWPLTRSVWLRTAGLAPRCVTQ